MATRASGGDPPAGPPETTARQLRDSKKTSKDAYQIDIVPAALVVVSDARRGRVESQVVVRDGAVSPTPVTHGRDRKLVSMYRESRKVEAGSPRPGLQTRVFIAFPASQSTRRLL